MGFGLGFKFRPQGDHLHPSGTEAIARRLRIDMLHAAVEVGSRRPSLPLGALAHLLEEAAVDEHSTFVSLNGGGQRALQRVVEE